jgi:hypothetical protein
MNVSEAMSELGRIGGQVKSPAKAAAARRNGKLGGRPKITDAQIRRFASKVIDDWRRLEMTPSHE